MNRLEAWGKYGKIDYPEDILKMRAAIPELDGISDVQIQDMYGTWSEDYYCASWLMGDPDGYTYKEFGKWILSDVDCTSCQCNNGGMCK